MSTPPNSDSAQLGPYFLISRTRNQGVVEHDMARRYGQDGCRAPDALDADSEWHPVQLGEALWFRFWGA